MRPKAVFTQHAFDRVAERLHLSPDEVAVILDTGTTTPLGLERGSRRMHRLFYSKIDRMCFVAVQDEKTGEVVTILPPDYDRHCRIDLAVVSDLALMEENGAAEAGEKILKLTFKLHFQHIHKGPKRIRAMKLPWHDHRGNLKEVEASAEVQELVRAFASRVIQKGEQLTEIFVQFGGRGSRQRFHLEDYNLDKV